MANSNSATPPPHSPRQSSSEVGFYKHSKVATEAINQELLQHFSGNTEMSALKPLSIIDLFVACLFVC